MLRRIDARNFCQYLALVNMLSFNFGFHVHEKAFMLVTIPLAISLFMNQHSTNPQDRRNMYVDVQRFIFLKLFILWTFWPLVFTMYDILPRHLAAFLDWIVFILVINYQLRAIEGTERKNEQ